LSRALIWARPMNRDSKANQGYIAHLTDLIRGFHANNPLIRASYTVAINASITLLWAQISVNLALLRKITNLNTKSNIIFTITLNLYIYTTYWVVRKVCTDFEGKLKRRRFKFLISFIKFKSFAARTFRTTQYIITIVLY